MRLDSVTPRDVSRHVQQCWLLEYEFKVHVGRTGIYAVVRKIAPSHRWPVGKIVWLPKIIIVRKGGIREF